MTSSELILSGSALAVAGTIIGALIANSHRRRTRQATGDRLPRRMPHGGFGALVAPYG